MCAAAVQGSARVLLGARARAEPRLYRARLRMSRPWAGLGAMVAYILILVEPEIELLQESFHPGNHLGAVGVCMGEVWVRAACRLS